MTAMKSLCQIGTWHTFEMGKASQIDWRLGIGRALFISGKCYFQVAELCEDSYRHKIVGLRSWSWADKQSERWLSSRGPTRVVRVFAHVNRGVFVAHRVHSFITFTFQTNNGASRIIDSCCSVWPPGKYNRHSSRLWVTLVRDVSFYPEAVEAIQDQFRTNFSTTEHRVDCWRLHHTG